MIERVLEALPVHVISCEHPFASLLTDQPYQSASSSSRRKSKRRNKSKRKPMHGDGQDAATKVPPDLAAALALGDYERAAAVECSTALRVEAAMAERSSGRREPVFASRAITSMAIALSRRGQMEDAIAMLNAEARLAKELSEHLAGQGCNPSERAVLEKCLVRAEREDSYILCRETVRNELFDLFGIWIGSGPHTRLPARAPACPRACLPGRAPARLPARPLWPVVLSACVPACQPASQPASPFRLSVGRWVGSGWPSVGMPAFVYTHATLRDGTHRLCPARPRGPRKRVDAGGTEKEKDNEHGGDARRGCTCGPDSVGSSIGRSRPTRAAAE